MSFRVASTSARAMGPVATSSRCFTTSPAVLAGGKGPKKTNLPQGVKKRQTMGFIKHKDRSSAGVGYKPLSFNYSMAHDPPNLGDMKQLVPEYCSREYVGSAATYPSASFDKIKSYGFPRGLNRELTKSGLPASVIRQHTVDLIEKLNASSSISSTDNRYMLTGEKGCGKSTLMLQAVNHAFNDNWIVLYFPKVGTWMDGSAPYAYNADTQMYDQPTISKAILETLLKTNATQLQSLKLPGGDQTVADLARKVSRKENEATKGLQSVMKVLTEQKEFPVLLAVDEAQALFWESKYRSPHFEKLQSYNFSVSRMALDYLSGRESLSRGMVLSAYSHTTPNSKLSPELIYTLSLPPAKFLSGYENLDAVHLAHASSQIQTIPIPFGMSSKEAIGMFEIWSRKGWTQKGRLWTKVTKDIRDDDWVPLSQRRVVHGSVDGI